MIRQLAQVAEGLQYLHDHDPVIVHGDIKGVNVYITWLSQIYANAS